jgi:hypothetical protein
LRFNGYVFFITIICIQPVTPREGAFLAWTRKREWKTLRDLAEVLDDYLRGQAAARMDRKSPVRKTRGPASQIRKPEKRGQSPSAGFSLTTQKKSGSQPKPSLPCI